MAEPKVAPVFRNRRLQNRYPLSVDSGASVNFPYPPPNGPRLEARIRDVSLSGMSIVFSGTIWAAYGEYENQPDVGFTMEANGQGIYNVTSAIPTSYPKSFGVEEALKTIAQKMGLTLRNFSSECSDQMSVDVSR